MNHPYNEPTHCYSLAFCVHIIAYVLIVVSAFTPYWSEVTVKNGNVETKFSKGPILSCDFPGGSSGCDVNKNISDSSVLFFVCFILIVGALFLGFLIFQTLIAGQCVRSLRHRNIAVALTVEFGIQVFILITCMIMFNESLPKDLTPPFQYKAHSFGLSWFSIVGAAILTFVCVLLSLVEHFKRRYRNNVRIHRSTEPNINSISGSHASGKPRRHPYVSNSNNNNNNNNNSNYHHNSSKVRVSEKFNYRPRDNLNNHNRGDWENSTVVSLPTHAYGRF